jgi:lipopolysaccharide transport system ATP-binding protein
MSGIIQVQNLSKRYRIGKTIFSQNKHASLIRSIASPFQYLIDSLRPPTEAEIIWALRDVSFEAQRGDVLGIVGRNGAGKSTLLKILSRITEPSSGKAVIQGRVGALLEVGTGFHPELTGRENIYLNGTILGMKRREINQKFDEIVEFSEIGKFLDTPVKRYSSGMYVRLAFSVAAHLEPEILLIDEVLAVGDLAFQQKCLNRIRDLTSNGTTILLVSHNMAVIQSSCTKVLFFEKGRIAAEGDPLETIEKFRHSMQRGVDFQTPALTPQNGDEKVNSEAVGILNFDMVGEDNVSRRDYKFGEPIKIRIELDAKERIDHPMINLGIRRGDGVVVCNFNNWYDNFDIDFIEGRCILEGWLPPLRLVPDFYEINVLVWREGGNHISGDPTHSKPLAWSIFGDFNINGVGLNSEDGIIQIPAQKWRFQRGNYSFESGEITEKSLMNAFEDLQKL